MLFIVKKNNKIIQKMYAKIIKIFKKYKKIMIIKSKKSEKFCIDFMYYIKIKF